MRPSMSKQCQASPGESGTDPTITWSYAKTLANGIKSISPKSAGNKNNASEKSPALTIPIEGGQHSELGEGLPSASGDAVNGESQKVGTKPAHGSCFKNGWVAALTGRRGAAASMFGNVGQLVNMQIGWSLHAGNMPRKEAGKGGIPCVV